MKTSDFLTNLLKYCIPSIVSAIVSIAVIPIISSIYPTDEYGKINLFYSMGNMILYIVLLGLDSAYIRYYFEQPKGVSRDQIFKLTFWTGLLFNAVALLLCITVFRDKVSNYLFGENHTWLIILLSIYVFSLVQYRLLSIETRMENKALLFNLQQILLIFTNRVSFILVAFWSTDYKYAIAAITISSVILGLVFTIIQKRIKDFAFPKLKKEALKTIFLFAIPLMPTTVMTWMNNSAAKMILTGYKNFNAVGILSIATSVANVFSIVPSAFATYWSPFIYKNHEKEQEFIKKVHGYICSLSVLIVIAIYVFQDILYVIVGANYKSSQAYFLLVMMGPIQALICETTSYGIILSNHTKYNMYIAFASLVANVSIGYFLYPVLGHMSVVVGIFVAALLQLGLKSYYGQKNYVSIDNKTVSLISVAMIIFMCISNYFLFDKIIVRICLSFVLLILWFVIYKSIVFQLIENLKKRINRKKKMS